jgi:predicted P-loop ATPase/GTPase
MDAVPLKARAGHNYWYQYDMLQPCLKEGRLYCSDIIKLKKASGSKEKFEILNPIDTLITPLNTYYYLENETSRNLHLANRDLFNHLVMERYTILKNGGMENTILLRESPTHLISTDIIEKITSKADKIEKIDHLDSWTSFYDKNASNAITTCTEYLKTHEVIVSEGFCDIIYPAPLFQHEVVVGVSPGTIVIYDSNRFCKAVKYHTRERKSQFRASEIVSYLKPMGIYKIPPLTKSELDDFDKLSKTYQEPLESILTKL